MAGVGISLLRKWKEGSDGIEKEWGSLKVLEGQALEKLTRAELRNHLDARDQVMTGTKKQMIERLRSDLEAERLRSVAYAEQIASEFVINKDIEERGSVYGVGTNHAGQLGTGDLEPREVFTVVSKTRGLGVIDVAVNSDTCFALTADHEVLVWGGRGQGPTGFASKKKKKLMKQQEKKTMEKKDDDDDDEIDDSDDDFDDPTAESDSMEQKKEGFAFQRRPKTGNRRRGSKHYFYAEPRIAHDLNGEEVAQVCVGASHSLSTTSGGDVFVWGHNLCGQLGLTDFVGRETPTILNFFERDASLSICRVSAGENHSVALSTDGRVYCWGHVDAGKLGLGVDERYGAREQEKYYFPSPTLVSKLAAIQITDISCGAAHTLALAVGQVFAWGHGAGGRLGLGDCRDRIEPTPVPTLNGACVRHIVAATWHSAAIVSFPPLADRSGVLYTWGSGYHGQLGLGSKHLALIPEVVKSLVDRHINATIVALGSHHSAILAQDGELYTWGSNAFHCLGRDIKEKYVEHTPVPGHVSGFGAIVDRIGRGMVRAIACGREFTIVATAPYEGPSESVAIKLMEEEAVRAEILREEEEQNRLIMEEEERENKQFGDDDLQPTSFPSGGGGGHNTGGAIIPFSDQHHGLLSPTNSKTTPESGDVVSTILNKGMRSAKTKLLGESMTTSTVGTTTTTTR